MYRVYDAGELENPFQFYSKRHIVVSLRGGKLWVVVDTPEGRYSKKEINKLRKMGFKVPNGFTESLYYEAKNIGGAVRVVREVSKALGVNDIVCARMDRVLCEKIASALGTTVSGRREEEDIV